MSGAKFGRSIMGLAGEVRRNGETKCLCGLEVSNELEFGRCLNREITRPCPPKDAVDVFGGAPHKLEIIGTIRGQTTAIGEISVGSSARANNADEAFQNCVLRTTIYRRVNLRWLIGD